MFRRAASSIDSGKSEMRSFNCPRIVRKPNKKAMRIRKMVSSGQGWLFFFSSRRRHTRLQGDWSSDVCSSDLSPLVIHYSVGGSATNGIDYTPSLSGSVTIPTGQKSTTVTLSPVSDGVAEGDETDRKSVV